MNYAIAKYPTPVLSTAAFQSCFGGPHLPLDDKQLLRPIETVLFPKTKIELLQKMDSTPIWRIQTREYPSNDLLYVDERFLTCVKNVPKERKRTLPSVLSMCNQLKKCVGARYIWGGNWPKGVPQLFKWYAPALKKERLDPLLYDTWQLKGVDCSGLLYFVSHGCTPRNTSELIHWGKSLRIAHKNAQEIAKHLSPLDLIVWKGHVVIILDAEYAIESRETDGVVITPLIERLNEILQERKALDHYRHDIPCFVIKRWLQLDF